MRTRNGNRRNLLAPRCFLVVFVCVVLTAWHGRMPTDAPELTFHASRHLLSHNDSHNNSHTEGGGLYPDDLLLTKPYDQAKNGYLIIFHFIGVLYMFSGLAIVCDDFFVGALEEMVDRWQITPDVAGATLMAAGGSAPELFTSLMGVTVSESDVGFGTIVGSAVFNVLFVIGLCALFAKSTLALTWWPLFRDCTYYAISLLILALLVNSASTEEGKKSGGEIEFWEALVLFIMYGGYVFIMSNNDKLKEFVENKLITKAPVKPMDIQNDEPKSTQKESIIVDLQVIHDIRGAALRCILNGTVDKMAKKKLAAISKAREMKKKLQAAASFVLHQARTASLKLTEKKVSASLHRTEDSYGANEIVEEQDDGIASSSEDKSNSSEEEDNDDPFAWPDSRGEQVLFLLNFPLQVLLRYTIPDCTTDRWKNWFGLTFFLSLVWIAVFSFFMVWWAEIIGQVLHIPANVMGLTFLAAGTSIPDALSSVIVARQGFGDMAVSSSVGSNIFDILFGLPVPWMIKTGIILKGSGVVLIQSKNLVTNVLILLLMVLFVVLAIRYTKWKLDRKLGFIMFILYVLFLMVSFALEYCSNLGLCDSS